MVGISMFALIAASGCVSAEYTLEKSYVGEDFFGTDQWNWFTETDPTEGAVQYVDRQTALSRGMAKATANRVYIGPGLAGVVPGQNIPSVRLESAKRYDSGLIIITMDHQPSGCGVWPAFWMTGDDEEHPWPVRGEADFIEGAHAQNEVWTTLHTLQNCDQSALKSGVDFSGHRMVALDPIALATNCSIKATDQAHNEGCPIVGPEGTMGPMFNAAGGGTFAFDWDPSAGHIQAFFWPAGKEPADIRASNPEPSRWGMPYSKFVLSEQACSVSRFANMKIIINTDFCGAWGQYDKTFHEKCPQAPAEMTCGQWVSTFPGNLTEAFWSITRLDIFQRVAHEELVI